MNRTGSIPFFTSANSSRSWGVFWPAEERLAEGGGQGVGGGDCGVQAGVGGVGLGQWVLPLILRLQGLGSAWGSEAWRKYPEWI